MKQYLMAAAALGALLLSPAALADQGRHQQMAQAPAPNPTNQQSDPAGGGQSKPGVPAKPGPQGGPPQGAPEGGSDTSAGPSGQTPDTSGTAGKPGGKSGPAEKKP